MEKAQPHISVIICTRDRADSLAKTLECLASANREGIRAEVMVVDNASRDRTQEVAATFSTRIPIRYLYEPGTGEFGKSRSLNRALDAGIGADIIAVLDDDMSPDAGWFQGVKAISERWPHADIFTGDTYVVWPSADVPEWAKKPALHSWIFSSCRVSGMDSPMKEGRWFSGNHWWFRSRVLTGNQRFKEMWLTEPAFQLDLVDRGFCGVAGRDAVAGHRIQPDLLQRDIALRRAKQTGGAYARLRLQPYRKHIKQARILARHPLLGRLFCLANCLRWWLWYITVCSYGWNGRCFEYRLIAVERMTTYRELFRTANRAMEYSLLQRVGRTSTSSSPGARRE